MNFINLKNGYGMEKVGDVMKLEKYLEQYVFTELKSDIINQDVKDKISNFRAEFEVNSIKHIRNQINSAVNTIKQFGARRIEIINTYDANKEELLDYAKKYNIRLKAYTKKFPQDILYFSMIDKILNINLWHYDTRLRTYHDIRKINDLILYDDGIITDVQKSKILNDMNKILVSSQRLLYNISLFQFFLPQSNELYDMTMKGTGFNDLITISYANSVNKRYQALMKNKSDVGGKQFGIILNLKEENQLNKKFFIKAYMGYYTNAVKKSTGNAETESTIQDNSHSVTGTTNIRVMNILDLKEPFVYKVLEQLNIGPQTNFIINPYINNGFYIATDDLNIENKQKFIEIGSIKGNTGLENTELGFTNLLYTFLKSNNLSIQQNKDRDNVFVEVIKTDIIARLFKLRDFNTGNFGCIVKNDELNEDGQFIEQTINSCEFKVVDFVVPEYNLYTNTEIGEQFLSGNTTIKYSKGSIMSKILVERTITSKDDDTTVQEKKIQRNLQEKFYFGYKALSQLEKRLQIYGQKHQGLFVKEGNIEDTSSDIILTKLLETEAEGIKKLMQVHRNDLPVLANRTNAELIGFKNGLAPEDIENERERLKYLDNAFKDLDVYCDNVVTNYRTLKVFIENGYNKYFDRNGNLKQNDL